MSDTSSGRRDREVGAAPASRALCAALEDAGYVVRGVLGRGGFGEVWDATRVADGLRVAIKTARPDHLTGCERLRTEAAALRAVGPPVVPALYEEGTLPGGASYLVFERLRMPSLARLLGAPLDVDALWRLAAPVLDALGAVHEAGLMHLDLKPENLFVSGSPPRATLIDFGLARPLAAPEPVAERTLAESSDGLILGTPLYMAPEQCDARPGLDERADIYAMGVILYEMATGRTPFAGETAEVRMAHMAHRPPPLSRWADVPPAFEEVVLRCLAKAPEQRIESAAALGRALEHALAGAPAPATPRPARASIALPLAVTPARHVMAGLLFFVARADTAAVQRELAARGARLVSVAGARCVAAASLDSGDGPVERALDMAEALIAAGVATRVLVDRERVRVHRSSDGGLRVFAPALQRAQRFPTDEEPPGVLFTEASASALPGVELAPVPGRGGVLVPAHGAPRHAAPGELVGRAHIIRALVDSARAAAAEQRPTLTTVLGASGHGKSRLAAAVLAELARERARIVHIRVRQSVGDNQDRALRALLIAALGLADLVDHAPADGGRAVLRSCLGAALGDEVWPAVALALCWLPADAPQVQRLAAAPAALRAAAARAAGEGLRRLAAEQPVLCVLDDVHAADDTTLDALEYATLAEARVPLWICVLARPDLAAARPRWGARAACAHTLHLPALADADAKALCRRLLAPAENVPEEVVARLVAHTRGNPLLLTELARAIQRQGLIRQHARGHTWYLAVDELEALAELPLAEWLADTELAALSDDLVAHARLAALLGAELSVTELDGVLRALDRDGVGEMFPLDAWVGTARLVERGLLVQLPSGRVAFRHAVLRELVARTVPASLRVAIHGAAFRCYRDARAVAEPRRSLLVAHHAAGSGAPEAGGMYLELADQARQRHDYLGAESLYSRALALFAAEDARGRVRACNGRGLMRYRLSRFGDALADLAEAGDLARALGDRQVQAALLLDEATVLDWMHDFEASAARVEAAGALAQDLCDPLLAARLALGLGRARFRRGELHEARRLLEDAAARAEDLGDAGYETQVIALMLLGWALISELGKERAEAVFSRSIALCEERGDRLHLAAVLNNRRELRLAQGDVQRAAADALRAQRIGREIGQIGVEYATSYNLAELYYFAGDLDEARPHLCRALDIEPSCSRVPLARLLAARVHVLAGELASAGALASALEEAQAQARAGGDADALFAAPQALLCAAIALAAAGAGADAWTALEARAAQAGVAERAEVLEMRALTRERGGDTAGAAALVEQALALCARAGHLIERRLRAYLARLGP